MTLAHNQEPRETPVASRDDPLPPGSNFCKCALCGLRFKSVKAFDRHRHRGMARTWLYARSRVLRIGIRARSSGLLAAAKTRVPKHSSAAGSMNGDTWAWQPSKQARFEIRRGDKLYREYMERVAVECEVEWELRRCGARPPHERSSI